MAEAKVCTVTGANGFVGSAIVRALLRRGYDVTALVGADIGDESIRNLPVKIRELDLLDPVSVRQALRGGRRLIHTAACYSFWLPDVHQSYRVNLTGTRNVLETAREFGYEKIVHTSTAGTLSPGFEEGPRDEENILDLGRFRGHYKMSKAMAELLALRMAAGGLPVVIVHPTTVIGSGDRRPTPSGEMIVHYINGRMKAYVEMMQNIVDVDDVAMGHVLALERGRCGERYVLGGENLEMRDLLRLLDELTGIPAPRVAIPNPLLRVLGRVNEWLSNHVTHRPPLFPYEAALHARDSEAFSSAKASRELGFRPRAAREAVSNAVRWFVSEGYCGERHAAHIARHGALVASNAEGELRSGESDVALVDALRD